MCDIEDTVNEWFDKQYYERICTDSLKKHVKHQIDDFLVSLEEQFTITHVEVGGIDFSVWKIYLKGLTVEKLKNKSKYYPDINV